MPTARELLPPDFSAPEREQLFAEIMYMYDLVDEVLNSLERIEGERKEMHGQLIMPMLTQVIASVNAISERYTDAAHDQVEISREFKQSMESAFQSLFLAVQEYIDNLETRFLPREEI